MIAIALAAAALAGPVAIPRGAIDEDAADHLLAGRRFALLVGSEAFADPGLPALAYPDDDAKALGAALSDPAEGRSDRVWTLTSTADTSLAGVRKAMAALSAEELSPDDTVVVYFSTHGTLAEAPGGRFEQEGG